MQIHVRLAGGALRCAVCWDPLPPFKAACPGCGTHVHFACRALAGGCPTLGCPQRRPPRARIRLRVTATPSQQRGLPRGVEIALCLIEPLLRFVFWAGVLMTGGALLLSQVITFVPPEAMDRARVRADVRALDQALALFRVNVGRDPRSLAELTTRPPGEPRWQGPYLDEVPLDPWGTPYVYEPPTPPHRGFTLVSYGADGVPGGEGPTADLVFPAPPFPAPP